MKSKLLAYLLLVLFFSELSYSQKVGLSYGVFTGMNLATNYYTYEIPDENSDASFRNDPRTVFSIGGFISASFTKNFEGRFQLQYADKGGIVEVNVLPSQTFTNTIQYLQFSILPQLNLPIGDSLENSKVFAIAGGYFSTLLKAKEKIESETSLQNQQLTTEKKVTDKLNSSDLGLIFGGGIVYKGFLIEVRYDLGLSDIVKDPDVEKVLSISNSSINFTVGYTGGF
jgi:hypothetical protein